VGGFGIDAARHVNGRKLFMFMFGTGGQFRPFTRQIRAFGIGLAADLDIFPRRHRHGANHQPGDARH
jgi:hypothetical protein